MASESTQEPAQIDNVRASRDGHTFHDTWTARIALELLVPTTDLVAVAVEGFSTEDAPIASAAATEIADLTRYRGALSVGTASQVEVVQFKYSIAAALEPMRAADIKKTLEKFSRAENDFVAEFGREKVTNVLRYELVTNRPFHIDLVRAIDGIRRGVSLSGDLENQANAVKNACNLPDDALIDFLERLSLSGRNPGLLALRSAVHRTIANWGAASDTLSKFRLSNLCKLCRDKAGVTGQNDNLISRVDVLAALDVAHEDELFPTPDAFPSVGETIERPIVDAIVATILEHGPPILVHSAGGVGKTVLMQALSRRFDDNVNAVVLFDCYGAGRWRDPADGRHEVQRALPHIANLLAGRGLCDVLLPGGATADIARAFRERLVQAVGAARAADAGARVVLFLDAIDHSALQADKTHSDAFTHVLLKTLSIRPIDGVAVVASCRTERRDLARDGAECREIPIDPFSQDETLKFIGLRDQTATITEVAALYTRSGGNPRVLDALVRNGRPYDNSSPVIDKTSSQTDLLDNLLQRKIDDSRREAIKRGLSEPEVDALLAGLALLPPPVPLIELAAAEGRSEAAIESFAADLVPLVERTPHGLIFRDEPTETLIRRLVENDQAGREAVIERLGSRQNHSNYAARAMPIVLTALGRTDDLIQLAFNSIMPESATSRVAQRAIRLSRLAAALVACSAEKRTDELTKLLLEAARVAGGNERSDRFLREHPDLVAISGDPEAVRRLFEVRSGWPGGRHAALSIVHALSDEPGEARRNARRALDWLNWRSRQPQESSYSQRDRARTDDLDRIGPAYVEALAGNTVRVAVWLDQWNEQYACRLYSRLLQLLENHAEISTKGRAVRDSIIRRAVRSRSRSRALPAALLEHAELSLDDRRRVIRRLATVSAARNPIVDERHHDRSDYELADGLLRAAIQAVRFGQEIEATLILDRIGIRRLHLYDFDSPLHASEIVRFFLAAAVRATLEKRTPHLMDVVPEEVHARIRLRKRSPSSAEYEAAIEGLLKDQSQGSSRRRKPRKTAFDYRDREHAVRTLNHRVRPLLPIATAVTRLLRANDSSAELANTFETLAKVVSGASAYPYRDGPWYTAAAAFDVVFRAADALGALTASNSKGLVEWLVNSPIQSATLWTYVVSVLSRRSETQAAAIVLAKRTATLIESGHDIGEKVAAYGALARSVWRTSRGEAGAFFRKGLDIADAIGSDDYTRASDLIQFATNYSGPPVRPETVHTFARICELTLFDEEKFAWTNFGEALARLGGPQAIAVLARLADREKASLGFSLPPLLTSLVKLERLDADLAMGMIGLDEPVSTWSWSLADFAKAALPRMERPSREKAVGFLLCEIDRRYEGTPPRETLEELLAACRAHLSPESANIRQIEILIDATEKPKADAPGGATEPRPAIPEWEGLEEQAATMVDPFNSASIDTALSTDEAEKAGRWSVRFLRKLSERAQRVDDRLALLRAVTEAKVPTLADKLLALEDQVKVWREESAAIASAIPGLALELSVRHAEELVAGEWESSYELRKLIEFSNGSGVEIISAVINALRAKAADISGAAWMEFACVAARTAGADAIHSALARFTSMSASALPEEVGDGPWSDALSAPNESVQVVAGLLWLRLGSPIARERWRAAHSLRRLVDLHRWDAVEALTHSAKREDAGPFQDSRLPFFFLHARFWLLIALARTAKDAPQSVLPFRSFLQEISFNDSVPHVGMRHFAAQGLMELLDHLPVIERTKLRIRLEGVNTSPFPSIEEKKPRLGFYHSHGIDRDDASENPFHFDYDFSKGEIDSLASIFGSDHQDVVALTAISVRRWSKDVKNMWECPRRRDERYFERSANGGGSRDTWGGHLAWHALMVAAGELLQKQPIAKHPYKDDPWGEWLDDHTLSRKDGFWLADATDPYPSGLYARTVSSKTDEDVPHEPLELGWLVGLNEGTLSEELTISGWWKSEDGLEVNVDSVLVDGQLAERIAFALLTVDAFDRWFPSERDFSSRDISRIPLQRLFREPEDLELKLDRKDPYASPTAEKRPMLAAETEKVLELRPGDRFRRVWWNNLGLEVAHGEAWGAESERRDQNGDKSGYRLSVRVDSLMTYLKSTRKRLVLLVKVQKYLKDDAETSFRRRRRETRFMPFRTQTLVSIVSHLDGLQVVRRIPKVIREAVKQIPDAERYQFDARLRAIASTRPSKKSVI